MKNESQRRADYSLDCSGHFCPAPILMAEEKIAQMQSGKVLEVLFTDPGAKPDFEAWCRATGNALVDCRMEKFHGKVLIKKGK